VAAGGGACGATGRTVVAEDLRDVDRESRCEPPDDLVCDAPDFGWFTLVVDVEAALVDVDAT
jgi:hypothetical protein